MEERVLKWLEIHEMRVLKQIILISDRKNGETELGSVLYTRPLSDSYNFKKQQEEDEQSKTDNSLTRLIQEYPKQKNYPNDRMDEIIFDAVKKSYPKSLSRNDTILFNVDLEKIETLKNRLVIGSSLYFSPEFSNVGNFHSYVGRTFKAPSVNLNIYSYYRPEFLDGQIFYANYNATEEDVLDLLKTVKFE